MKKNTNNLRQRRAIIRSSRVCLLYANPTNPCVTSWKIILKERKLLLALHGINLKSSKANSFADARFNNDSTLTHASYSTIPQGVEHGVLCRKGVSPLQVLCPSQRRLSFHCNLLRPSTIAFLNSPL